MLRWAIIFLNVLVACLGITQTSFQKAIQSGDVLLRNPKIDANGKNYFLQGVAVSTQQRRAYFSKLNENGDFLWSKVFGNVWSSSNIVDFHEQNTNIYIPLSETITNQSDYFLIHLDANGQLGWNIKIAENVYNNAPLIVSDTEQNLWVSFEKENNNFSQTTIAKLNPNGNVIWAKTLDIKTDMFVNNLVWSEVLNALIFCATISEGGFPRNIICAMNQQGKILWAWKAVNFRFNVLHDIKTKLYLYSVKTSSQLTDIISIHDIFSGKALEAKALDDVETTCNNNNTLLLQYGNNDLVVAYDENFTPIWFKNYPSCSAQPFVEMNVNENGDCIIWKEIKGKVVLTKPNKNGNLSVCKQNDGILPEIKRLDNRTFVEISKSIEISDYILPLQNKAIEVNPFNQFETANYCPDFPDATFSALDTVCLGQEFSPKFNTSNSFSNIWNYDGNTIKSDTPKIQINKKGFHTLLHIVDNSTCIDSFKQVIFVQTIPEIPFENITLCNEKQFDLKINEATQYWLDGIALQQTNHAFEKNGQYHLKVTNDFCENEKFFTVNLTQSPSIHFAIDSVYCKGFPYHATIKGFDAVFWNNQEKDSISIFDDKIYMYRAKLGNCEINGQLQIPRKDCEALIFMPTIFSPNDDGINDTFEPLGDSFQVLDFQIFNRWGNIIFKSDKIKNYWNGKINNQIAPQGIYFFTLQFLNLRTNEIETKKGDFLLIDY